MSFGRYPEYKNSNIEWIGEVPKHWQIASLRWYATIQGGIAKGKSYDAQIPVVNLPYLRVANVQDGYCDLSSVSTVTVAASEVDRYRLQPGDVLMNEGGDNDKLGRGAVWEGQVENCLHQNHVFAIRPNRHLFPHWLSMFTRSAAARSYFYLYSKQSTNLASISSSNVMSCPLPFPPPQEQQQILRFLDHETAKIDALIREQERLIELLQEKRQAVISHAVTKGLGPDVPMKDSGVEWLGEVPAHWECMSYRYATRIIRGKFGHRPRNDPALYDGLYPFIQTGDVAQAEKYIHEFKQTLNGKGAAVSASFPAGTLVMAIAANIGDTAILGFEAYAPDSVVGFQPRPDITLEFLKYSLDSSIQELEKTSTQSTQANLNIDRIGSVKAVFPPASEQGKIVSYLDNICEKYSALEKQAFESIELMSERRSALISAAVTGKIDVRDWRPPADESAFGEEGRQSDMEVTA